MRRRNRLYTTQRNSYSYRRRRKNWIPFLIFVSVLGLFFWAVFQFFSLLFSSVRTEASTTQVQILKGRAEFKLSGEEEQENEWNPAFSEQTFVEGDSVRTAKNSKAELKFFDTNSLFLNQNSEISIQELSRSSSGEKSAKFVLEQGEVWGHVSESEFFGTNSKLVLSTERLNLYVDGTIFDLNVTPESDTVRLTKGKAHVDILNGNKKSIKTLNIGVGQELVVNSQTVEKILANEEVVGVIDPAFVASDWNIENLAVFDPEGAEVLKKKNTPSLIPNSENSGTTEVLTESNVPTPEVISPENGTSIPASQDIVAIEGTSPLEAFQILINGYALSKFQPGDRKWTYFAATKFDTLKPGENKYIIEAVSREGEKSLPAHLTINYEGIPYTAPAPAEIPAENPSLPENSEKVPEVSNFPKPKVTSPEIFVENPEAVYQTSAAVTTFAGEVPSGTNSVEVNGFKLRKFNAGDTKFSYIANANYGNMKEGENTYTIVVYGPDNARSQTQIKIVYTPLNVGE